MDYPQSSGTRYNTDSSWRSSRWWERCFYWVSQYRCRWGFLPGTVGNVRKDACRCDLAENKCTLGLEREYNSPIETCKSKKIELEFIRLWKNSIMALDILLYRRIIFPKIRSYLFTGLFCEFQRHTAMILHIVVYF